MGGIGTAAVQVKREKNEDKKTTSLILNFSGRQRLPDRDERSTDEDKF